MLTLRDSIRRFVPPWLSDRPGRNVGFRLLYCLAAPLDAAAQWAVEGIKARFPGYGTPTALPHIGRDRCVVRGFSESETSFAARLLRWRDDWKTAGNAFTLLRQIQGYLTPHEVRLRVVTNRGTWYTLNADGTEELVTTHPSSNWDWDGQSDLWSRFWVIIYPPASLWQPMSPWGDSAQWGGAWGTPGVTWGTTATTAQIATLKGIVKRWKAAHAKCVNIIIAFDPSSFDPQGALGAPLPDGTWGTWHKVVGGVAVKSRLSSARYVEVDE